ncbi:hypothetical protein PC116_g4660 [Phytophthora cactorum]|uniref:Uncharacterized protein n=1 Tax=Phytophthora cactorum TaxID=29920 RepID=A0A8T1DCE6_9STRA|nr:hypothetical protein Pcac1_g22680 [Phytophthora cactorum]KAG2930043.1 hypothetical protein PC114_g2553 [Phytophthora cactorum]KAG2938648.1 hypothetical protein PC117_g11115 [Phytophthora cactorum]KAG3014715.1 hypothetical protein PC120_g12536 [Phytophthora cactorum]KAG3016678.1 hypothetical protein PC119_g11288 [Phytophthora cactorum]
MGALPSGYSCTDEPCIGSGLKAVAVSGSGDSGRGIPGSLLREDIACKISERSIVRIGRTAVASSGKS